MQFIEGEQECNEHLAALKRVGKMGHIEGQLDPSLLESRTSGKDKVGLLSNVISGENWAKERSELGRERDNVWSVKKHSLWVAINTRLSSMLIQYDFKANFHKKGAAFSSSHSSPSSNNTWVTQLLQLLHSGVGPSVIANQEHKPRV